MKTVSEKMMEVCDVFAANDGRAVLAGTDMRFDCLEATDIRRLIGPTISVRATKNFDDVRIFSVLDVEVSQSLIGKKNVFVKLDVLFENAKCFLGGDAILVT